jgi:hypothetical protein
MTNGPGVEAELPERPIPTDSLPGSSRPAGY